MRKWCYSIKKCGARDFHFDLWILEEGFNTHVTVLRQRVLSHSA